VREKCAPSAKHPTNNYLCAYDSFKTDLSHFPPTPVTSMNTYLGVLDKSLFIK
jgi:hypothetical protein